MYINTELRHYSRAVFLSGECIEYRREGFLKHLRLIQIQIVANGQIFSVRNPALS